MICSARVLRRSRNSHAGIVRFRPAPKLLDRFSYFKVPHRYSPNRLQPRTVIVIPTEASVASESGGTCFGGAPTTSVLPAKAGPSTPLRSGRDDNIVLFL